MCRLCVSTVNLPVVLSLGPLEKLNCVYYVQVLFEITSRLKSGKDMVNNKQNRLDGSRWKGKAEPSCIFFYVLSPTGCLGCRDC